MPEGASDVKRIGGPFMKLRDSITAGVKSLVQNRLRSGVSILGIFIGIAGVMCMIAIGDGAKKILAEDIEKLDGANQFTLWTRTFTFKQGLRSQSHQGCLSFLSIQLYFPF